MTDRALPEGLRIRSAVEDDAAAIGALLDRVGLASTDVTPVGGHFIVGDTPDGIVGCVALDGQPPELLLRSLAVAETARGAGLGRLLVDAALLDAWARRVRRVVLVTESAEDFFARQGFETTDRSRVAPETAAHPQFNGACPDSAAVMAMDMVELG